MKNLRQTLEEDGRFARFLAAARTAELESNLRRNVVGQHVVHGRQTMAGIRTASTLRSFAGPPVTVAWEQGSPRFGNGKVTHGDIACTKGMIHVLDKLMLECSCAG